MQDKALTLLQQNEDIYVRESIHFEKGNHRNPYKFESIDQMECLQVVEHHNNLSYLVQSCIS